MFQAAQIHFLSDVFEAIVLVNGIQKSGTGDNNFVKWKGTFRLGSITSRCLAKWARTHLPDGRRRKSSLHFGPTDRNRNYQTGQSGPPSIPNIPVGLKPKWSVPFDVSTEISGILGWMESVLRIHMTVLLFFPKEMTLSGEFTRWSLCGLHGANN